MSDEKKEWVVEGIKGVEFREARDIQVVAENIEEALNAQAANGYDSRVMQAGLDYLVVGMLVPVDQRTDDEAPEMTITLESTETSGMNDEAAQQMFATLLYQWRTHQIEIDTVNLPKHIERLIALTMSRHSVGSYEAAAASCRKFRDEHDCADKKDCGAYKLALALEEALLWSITRMAPTLS